MARDWSKAFRPASFRGVPFEVDVEELSGSRRISIGPVAYGETSVLEDMGRNQRPMVLTAYTAGDVADARAIALIPALEAKGPGRLVAPMIAPFMARVLYWSISREKSRNGLVAIDIEFIENGASGLSALPGLPWFNTASALSGLASTIASAIDMLSDAATRTHSIAAGNRAATVIDNLGIELGSKITSALDTLASAASAPVTGSAYAEALTTVWRAAASDGDPETAEKLALDLIDSSVTSAVAVAEQAAIVGALAVSVLRQTYTARPDARRARDMLSAQALALDERIGQALGVDAFRAFTDMTGQAVIALSRGDADRAPMVRVEFGISLPSTVAAYRLYGDATRAEELVSRNKVSTPAFMPVTLEALAP